MPFKQRKCFLVSSHRLALTISVGLCPCLAWTTAAGSVTVMGLAKHFSVSTNMVSLFKSLIYSCLFMLLLYYKKSFDWPSSVCVSGV